MAREDVRARLRTLVWTTVELERLQEDSASEQPHTALHFAQEQRALIAELGLGSDASQSTKPSGDPLSAYLAGEDAPPVAQALPTRKRRKRKHPYQKRPAAEPDAPAPAKPSGGYSSQRASDYIKSLELLGPKARD